MATARVFRSGNSQAVRLPKKFRLKSKEVEIVRRGDEIVLREKPGTMVRAFELLAGLPDDIKLRGRQKVNRKSARGSEGASLPAGYEDLHLHPRETARGSPAPIPKAACGRGGAFGNYFWRAALRGK